MNAYPDFLRGHAAEQTTPQSPALCNRLLATMAASYAAWLVWRVERYAVAHLASMDDRGLADIGLTRTQIGFAVRYGRL